MTEQFSDAEIRRVGWHPPIEELPVTRGILYLLAWFWIGGPAVILTGTFVAGLPGAVVGAILVIPVGLFGYDRYLDWHVKRIGADYARTVDGIVERLRGMP